MTIQVTVENRDATRTVEVVEMRHSKAGSFAAGDITQLLPGEARSFHIHLLRDLHVREQEPR
jgi:hypothetical protein